MMLQGHAQRAALGAGSQNKECVHGSCGIRHRQRGAASSGRGRKVQQAAKQGHACGSQTRRRSCVYSGCLVHACSCHSPPCSGGISPAVYRPLPPPCEPSNPAGKGMRRVQASIAGRPLPAPGRAVCMRSTGSTATQQPGGCAHAHVCVCSPHRGPLHARVGAVHGGDVVCSMVVARRMGVR